MDYIMEEQRGLHLDKRIPIFTLVGLLVQIFAAIWFFAQLSSDVDANTANIVRVESQFNARADRHDIDASNRNDRVMNILNRIEDKIDRKVDR